jgi:Uri superfamily endonuclease
MKGSYILLIHLSTSQEITIGKLGSILFQKGWYSYIGSALNGLPGRINRHLRGEKNLHWHIDYLLKQSTIEQVYYKENETREECFLADQFNASCKPIPGFGCSDCSCHSHLYHGTKKQLQQIINENNMISYDQSEAKP